MKNSRTRSQIRGLDESDGDHARYLLSLSRTKRLLNSIALNISWQLVLFGRKRSPAKITCSNSRPVE